MSSHVPVGMSMTDDTKRRDRETGGTYQIVVSAAGILVCLIAAGSIITGYTWRELLVLGAVVPLITVVGFFPITFPLPTGWKASNEKINFTVIDAFVLTTAFSFGIAPAILIAGIEGFTSSRRLVRRLSSNLFSSSMMSLTAAAAYCSLSVILRDGSTGALIAHHSFSTVAAALLVASIVQVSINWGFLSTLLALRHGSSILRLWKQNFLCAAPMFLPTSVLASMMVFALQHGVLALMAIAGPVLLSIFFGHQYRAKAEQSEQAERERAQAERERAEQAECHVEELSRYVAELERTSHALQESKDHFRHAAFHDSLTGLPLRALLTDRLQLSIDRARLNDSHLFALLFLDLDRFKNINDSLGHVAGDQLLIAISRRLEGVLRPTDTVARLGGDEFAILLDGLEKHSHAIKVAERAQKELARPFNLDGYEVYTTASIGVALCATGYEHPESILRDADAAMYRAKENGKARYAVFDMEMHASAVSRLQLENDLRRAVERQEFEVYYQPIVALATENIVGFESLVRWQHPQRGMVAPLDFISTAEETGLIVDLGLWVLRESCLQMRAWQMQDPSLMISVNLSGKQFTADLIGQIKRILDETGLDPHSLKLEITESVVMENADTASSMLTQLRALGIQLSIDDFGTGYSSLSYLHRFPVNTLKIDRSFISRIDAGDVNTEIVRTIMALAINLGMEVVAEGVETEKQLETLKAMNCTYGQGYLFSKPLNAEAANAMILAALPKHMEVPRRQEELIDPAPSSLAYVN